MVVACNGKRSFDGTISLHDGLVFFVFHFGFIKQLGMVAMGAVTQFAHAVIHDFVHLEIGQQVSLCSGIYDFHILVAQNIGCRAAGFPQTDFVYLAIHV